MKIALTMIVKGTEWDEVERCLTSVGNNVDRVFITTTQTKDHTHKFDLVEYSHFDWVDDFSRARNFNLAQAKDYDYVLWLDSDDILMGADKLKSVINQMERMSLDAVFMDYHYTIDPNTGDVLVKHPRERIIRNQAYEWKGMLHETLIPNREIKRTYISDMWVEHYPKSEDQAKSLDRNIRILTNAYDKERMEVAENKRKEIDPRTEYYLARALFDIHTKESHDRAAQLFQDYLAHSGWDEERASAWHYLGHILFTQEQYKDAIKCYYKAIQESPRFPGWYVMLGRAYAAIERFEEAEHWVKLGLSIPQPNTSMITTEREDKMNALLTLYLVYFAQRKMKKALKIARAIAEIEDAPEHKRRVEETGKLVRWTRWLRIVNDMTEKMKTDGESDAKIRALISSLPNEIGNSVFVDKLRSQYLESTIWDKKSIVYYCGPAWEPWSPNSLKTGIGGSEEAVIYLANEWTKRGYKVTVYNDPGRDEGTYNGVEYRHWQRFNPGDEFNVLIAWRIPEFYRTKFKAKMTLLDLHDVPMPGSFTPEVVENINKIMVKSPYHRSLLPNIEDIKFHIVGNGIDTKMLDKINGDNLPHKIFWGSSYDRGIQGVLEIWPDVIKNIPDAELHICYGWNLFDKAHRDNPERMMWKNKMVKLMGQPGIIEHGRLGKKELYTVAKNCGLWVYPATFEEIHCITGAYAQFLGAVPVVYNYAALETTVQHGKKLDLDPFAKDSITKYSLALVTALKDNDWQNTVRQEMVGWARTGLGWNSVAREWLEVIEHE